MSRKILVAGAWPYANGSLHIGHIAGLLPGDVIARYHRANGDEVYYVSGSDCYGTPVTIRAKSENTTPLEVSNRYHTEFEYCFNKLGFSYDIYGRTTSREHVEFVKEFHKVLYESDFVYEKEVPQAYCSHCNTFLADRFVEGKCPECGEKSRGDQCDKCSTVLDPETLVNPTCVTCGNTPIFKETKHLYIALSKLENELQTLVNTHEGWRKNAIAFTNRYIKEGLRDRAITRDLDWGIDVPKPLYDNKKIYIWAENVLGYLSMSHVLTEERETDFGELWGDDAIHYYVHAKDNIPFHTIILPALLLAYNQKSKIHQYHLPDNIISNEYLTLEGRKISTSQNHAIWMKDIVDRYHPDSIRYFLITNGPEKRDTDFNWREFVNSHNAELLGAYGNLVNRSLVFVEKYFDSKVPNGNLNNEIEKELKDLYVVVGSKIERGLLKDGLDNIFDYVRCSNKYFDSERPWETRNSDLDICENTLFNCIQIITNLAILLKPFIPYSSQTVLEWLSISDSWELHEIKSGYEIPKTWVLFDRIDKSVIKLEEEMIIEKSFSKNIN